MKIIHLISGGDVGGAKTHVLTLLHGLNQTECAELICFTEGDFAADARALGIPTTILDGGFGATLSTLRRRIGTGGYDVIHCHGSKANMYGALLGKSLDLPVVTTVHSDPRLDYLGRPFHNLTYGTINRLALRRMSNWIAVSDETAKMLIGRGFAPQRVFTLYNGVDFSACGCALTREEYLRSLGVSIDEGTVVFGIAARITPVKDLTTLVRAFSQAVRRQPNIRLVIAGDGEQAEQIKALADELCPPDSVCFAGWVSDMDSFYNALDVNVLTSLSETFPYALTEGAKHRCATVSSRVGGVPYLIDDGINGLIFPPQDVQRLTDCMVRLADDPALRERFGARLYEKTREKFSLEATVSQQKQIYRSVLRRRARRSLARDGVMICGAYGKDNAGDDGILKAILSQLRAIDPELPICVISRRPKQTGIQFRVGAIHTFDIAGFLRAMRRTVLYISGGGSLIQDVTSSRSLQYYLQHIRAAKRRGNKVMMFGCGIGPVSRPSNRIRAGKIVDRYVDVITLRDTLSLRELERLGVTRPDCRLTADPALLLPPPDADREAAYLYAQGYETEKSYLMVSLRPWQGIYEKLPVLAAVIDETAAKYGVEPVLFALEPRRDLPVLEALQAQISCPSRIVAAQSSWEDLISVIRRMRAVVSMRLHPLIFAAGQGVPIAGIVYDPKVDGFMADLGSDAYCTIEALSEESARALFTHVMESSDGYAKTDAMRARAAENAEIAAKLLQEA